MVNFIAEANAVQLTHFRFRAEKLRYIKERKAFCEGQLLKYDIPVLKHWMWLSTVLGFINLKALSSILAKGKVKVGRWREGLQSS